MKNNALRDGNLKSPWKHGLAGMVDPTNSKINETIYDCLPLAGALQV